MKWYAAIKYSHKCFLLFLVVNLILELFVFLTREIYLFDEKDVFDTLKEKFSDKNSNQPNFEMTYQDLENNFMKSFHIVNSKEKVKKIKEFLKEESADEIEEMLNTKKERRLMPNRLKTVNLYKLYKNKEI